MVGSLLSPFFLSFFFHLGALEKEMSRGKNERALPLQGAPITSFGSHRGSQKTQEDPVFLPQPRQIKK
jgi:hypothetical protein